MPYGSTAGVAALSALWTDGTTGLFTTATRPTLAQVTTWLEEVSKLLDTALNDQGFDTPVTVSAVTGEFNLLVNGIVKDLCDYSHGAGRFFTEKALEAGINPFMTVDKELHEWVKRKVVGMEKQGVVRSAEGRNVASFEVF
jgi:hypothetical protein